MSRAEKLVETAKGFDIESPILSVNPAGEGLINDSYRVECLAHRYLLQRINTRVFTEPEKVMQNIQRVTEHLADKARQQYGTDWQRHVLTLIPGADGNCLVHDETGGCWRMYRFIEKSTAPQSVNDPEIAYSAARAFGSFTRELADLPSPQLHETIADFHNTPRRIEQLKAAAKENPHNRNNETDETIRRLQAHHTLAFILHDADMPIRAVHNDTKINNVLLDAETNEALCVVDLDTVMPGLALHDFADMVRSAAAVRPEKTTRLDLDIFESLLEGWLEGVGDILVDKEKSLLWVAPQVITLELAARFLTDHLEGDRYFKVNHPGQNLDRAAAQLQLLESMQRNEQAMRAISEKLLQIS